MSCPVLVHPDNGLVEPCDNTYQSVCNLTCNSGYIVSAGDLSRQCQANGFWIGENLICSGRHLDTDVHL